MKRYLPLLTGIALCSCTTTAGQSLSVVSPRQINENVAAFDGRTVSIKGYLRLGPELHLMEGSDGRTEDRKRLAKPATFNSAAWENDCLTVKPYREPGLSRFNGRLVEVIARVDKDYNAGAIDIGGCSTDSAIDIVRVVRIYD